MWKYIMCYFPIQKFQNLCFSGWLICLLKAKFHLMKPPTLNKLISSKCKAFRHLVIPQRFYYFIKNFLTCNSIHPFNYFHSSVARHMESLSLLHFILLAFKFILHVFSNIFQFSKLI